MLKKYLLMSLYLSFSFNALKAMEGDLSQRTSLTTHSHLALSPLSINPSIQTQLYPPQLLVIDVPESYNTKSLNVSDLKSLQEWLIQNFRQRMLKKCGGKIHNQPSTLIKNFEHEDEIIRDCTNFLNQKNLLKTPRKLFQSSPVTLHKELSGVKLFAYLVNVFTNCWLECKESNMQGRDIKERELFTHSTYWNKYKTAGEEAQFRNFQRLSNIFFHAYHTHFNKTLPPVGWLKGDVEYHLGHVFYYRDEHGFIPTIFQTNTLKPYYTFCGALYGNHLNTTYEVSLAGKPMTGIAWKEMLIDKDRNLVTTPGLYLEYKELNQEISLNLFVYTGDAPTLPYSIILRMEWLTDEAFILNDVLRPSKKEKQDEKEFTEKEFTDSEINFDKYYDEFFGDNESSLDFNREFGNLIFKTFSSYLSPAPYDSHRMIGFVPLPREHTSESKLQNYNFIEFVMKKAKLDQPEAIKCLTWIVEQEGIEAEKETDKLIAQAQSIQEEIRKELFEEELDRLKTIENKNDKVEQLPPPTQWTGAKHPDQVPAKKNRTKGGKSNKGRGNFQKYKQRAQQPTAPKQPSEEMQKKAQAFVEEEIGKSRLSNRKLRKLTYKAFKEVLGRDEENIIHSINTAGSHTMIHMTEGGVTIPRKHKGKGKDLTIPSGKAKNYIMKLLEKGIQAAQKHQADKAI